MNNPDLLLTGALLALAIAFLAWRLRPGHAPPPCQPTPPDNGVVVGDALARGLKRARKHRRAAQK